MALNDFFSKKMIMIETQYETYNDELLTIVEAFKILKHYLKGCKHEVFVYWEILSKLDLFSKSEFYLIYLDPL